MHSHLNHEALPVIVLAAKPRIFREVLRRALEKNSNLPLVLEAEDTTRLQRILNTINTRWLFITTENQTGLPIDIAELLHRHPEMSIACISLDGADIEIFAIQKDNSIRRDRHCALSLADVLKIVNTSYA